MSITDVSPVRISPRWLAPMLATLLLGCGSGTSDGNKAPGGIVGFATGSEAPGPVPSDGQNPAAPTITSVTASNPIIGSGQPLRIQIAFADQQGDVATVNFGIAGQTTHSTLSADIVGTKTSGSLTLDLYLKTYTPGTYTLSVSMTDKAGHTSLATSIAFTIVAPGGTVPPSTVDAGPQGGADASIATNSGHETYLLKMESVRSVSSNPPVPTTFTLSSASYVTRVWTYHYNATIGAKSPTLSFKDTTTGVVYGPWPQTGYKSVVVELDASKSDPGNVLGPPDNYWMAYPATVIPAGTYQVIDSEPATWAYTSDLGNRGVTWIYGWAGEAPSVDAGTSSQPDVRFDSGSSETQPPVIDNGSKSIAAIVEHAAAQEEAYATLLGLFSADFTKMLFDPSVELSAKAYDDLAAVQQAIVDTHDAYVKALGFIEGTRTKTGAGSPDGGAGLKHHGPLGSLKSFFWDWAYGNQKRSRERILTVSAGLDAKTKQEMYETAKEKFGDKVGSSPTDMFTKLQNGELDSQAPQLHSNFATAVVDYALQCDAKNLTPTQVAAKEGAEGLKKGVDVVVDSSVAVVNAGLPGFAKGFKKGQDAVKKINQIHDKPLEAIVSEIESQAKTWITSKVKGESSDAIADMAKAIANAVGQYLKQKNQLDLVGLTVLPGSGVLVGIFGSNGSSTKPADVKGIVVTGGNANTTPKNVIVNLGDPSKGNDPVNVPPGSYDVDIVGETSTQTQSVSVTEGTEVAIPVDLGQGAGIGGAGGSFSETLEQEGYWGHLSYTVSGAAFGTPGGDPFHGKMGTRTLTGTLAGSILTVSGSASSDNVSSGAGSLDYYEISVSVSVGAKSDSFSYIAPKGEKLNKPFSLSVPIESSATSGSFSIRLTEQNANYGAYGYAVAGTLTR